MSLSQVGEYRMWSEDIDYVKAILNYDPETGVFRWNIRPSNARKAGDIAGAKNGSGYIVIDHKGRNVQAHRLAWFYMTGSHAPEFIDHANGEPADNRFSNLRLATRAENARNRRASKRRAATVYSPKGVYQDKYLKWRSVIQLDGTQYFLGSFDTIPEAEAAYQAGSRILHKQFRRQ